MFAEYFGEAVAGWLLADLLSGIYHWWQDRVAIEAIPVFGPAIVTPGRVHHKDALAFTQDNVWKRNGGAWALVVIIAALWLWFGGPSIMLLTALAGGLLSGEIHVWTHLPERTHPAVRVLQEIGIIQSPRHHMGHHRYEDKRYCAVTDWLNPVLDGLKVWDRLERCLTFVGLEPNRGTR